MSPQTAPTMSHIHELLRQEFGRMAPSLDEDGTTQLVHLPGGRYAVVCRMTTPATITVSKTVALDLTFEQPGLADFLLREHADWLFGRFERVGGALRVEHTVTAAHVDGETLRRIVVAVHSSAFRAEGVLASCGVIDVEEER